MAKAKDAAKSITAPGRGREAATTAVVPRISGKRTEKQAPPPKLDESPPFLFTHHHEAWLVMGGRVVPRLGKLKLAPGLNGVELNTKTGEIQAQGAIDSARENGLVVLPVDIDGDGTSYLCSPVGAPHATLSRWERVYAGSHQVDCDEPGYVKWCLSLVERGFISPAPIYVLERMRARLTREIEDLAEAKSAASYIKRLQRDLAAVEAAIAEAAPEAETVPVIPAAALAASKKPDAADAATKAA